MGIDLERGRKNACFYSWPKKTAMCVVCSPGAVLGFAAQTSRASLVLALSSTYASLSIGTLQGLDEVERSHGMVGLRHVGLWVPGQALSSTLT